MDIREKILGLVYVLTIVLIIVILFEIWTLAMLFFLVLVITLIQKIHYDQGIDDARKKREKIIYLVGEHLEVVSKRLELLVYEIKKKNFFMENRMNKLEKESHENNYRDLVRKIVELENKLNEIKKTVAIVYNDVDSRIKKFEQ